ncbi:hypothetical protein MIT9_P2211 [Methylomarinovum caldicuralii]|uniref:Tetratricopeptide repeat protein n=1 Tax=Methylomarinovum caldicuralii TaxID=438856 RepID=A0AAU9CI11_9GAMM|nr:tetratricopeptide repeat protein [Methylomarinovum caldicuralii]BCX82625.1 hypothetical protein MIT9_P2211 [Methylomarinovum caldicuralii]
MQPPVLRSLPLLLIALFCATPAFAVPLGFTVMPQASEQTNAQDANYRAGLAALVEGRLEEAASTFRAELEQNPAAARSMLGLSAVARQRGNKAEATQWLEKALKTAPDDYHVLLTWGRHLRWDQRDLSGAEQAFRKATQADPKKPVAHVALGDVLQETGRAAEAAAEYHRAIEQAPNNAAAHYALGLALLRDNRPNEAQTALERAAQLAPENPLPLVALARLYLSNGRAKEALQAATEAVRRDPRLPAPRYLAARALEALDRPAEAEKAYRSLLQTAPQHADGLLALALLYHRQDRLQEAMAAYRQRITLQPPSPLAYNNLAWLVGEQPGKLEEAIGLARKAVALAPENPSLHDTLGMLLWRAGRAEAACREMRQAVRNAPVPQDIRRHWEQIRPNCK